MGIDLLPTFVRQAYEVHEWKHACAILKHDFPSEWDDLCELLIQFRFNLNTAVTRPPEAPEAG